MILLLHNSTETFSHMETDSNLYLILPPARNLELGNGIRKESSSVTYRADGSVHVESHLGNDFAVIAVSCKDIRAAPIAVANSLNLGPLIKKQEHRFSPW